MPSSEPNFDARMVDWLYDELDPAEAASFQKHLDANPQALAEANALRRTREAFREMDQSEPAPGLSSMLMHEAAQAVAQSPSLWARITGFFQPVFLHPAASAMATLVVVVGVAGALYSRNGDMSVQPTAAVSESEAPAQEKSAVAPASAPAPDLDGYASDNKEEPAESAEGIDEQRNEGYRVGLASDSAQGEISALERARRSEVAQGASTRGAKRKEGKKTAFAGDFGLSESEVQDGEAVPGNQLNAVSGGRGYAPPPPPKAERPSPVTSKSSDKRKPAKKRAAVSSRSKNAQTGSAFGNAREDDSSKTISWEDEKIRVLNAAAKDKRCKDAGRIANDILDKKPAYYKKNVKGSKAVSDCGRYVASETQRRSKMRKAQARKKAAGAPKKAKAAPELDSVEALD